MDTLISYSNQAEKLEHGIWNHSELEQIAILAGDSDLNLKEQERKNKLSLSHVPYP